MRQVSALCRDSNIVGIRIVENRNGAVLPALRRLR